MLYSAIAADTNTGWLRANAHRSWNSPRPFSLTPKFSFRFCHMVKALGSFLPRFPLCSGQKLAVMLYPLRLLIPVQGAGSYVCNFSSAGLALGDPINEHTYPLRMLLVEKVLMRLSLLGAL